MDVSSIVDFTLLPFVERTVTEAKDKLVEAIRHRYRSQEETDLAMQFVDEASLNRTLVEMKQLGVDSLQAYIKGMRQSFRSHYALLVCIYSLKVHTSFLLRYYNL